MSSGWIKLHRQLLEWEWYDDINTCRLFIHCILRANHANKSWRGQEIKRGDFLTSLESLNKETGLTISQIRTSLKKLISTNEIASKSQAKSRIITVIGYDSYQDDSKQVSKQVTGKSQASSNKQECKNEKKYIYQQIADAWNFAFPELPNVIKISDKRKAHINATVKFFKGKHDLSNKDTWVGIFDYAKKSDFLMGRSSDWSMDFDFIINKNNLLKVLEGKYE